MARVPDTVYSGGRDREQSQVNQYAHLKER